MIHAAGTAARWRRTTAILLAGALAAAAAVLGTASVASADTGYSLSGTVTDTGSAPLSGIQVTATTNLGSAIETTDANGEYTFPHLQAGEYTIRFDGGSDYVTQYYAGAADAASATSIDLEAAATGIDAVLVRKATLQGAVYEPGHQPVNDDWFYFTVSVTDATTGAEVWTENYYQGFDYTSGGPAAAYTAQVAPGTYRIRVTPPAGTTIGATYYSSAELADDAETVTVGDGEVRSGLDVEMLAGHAVRGTISPVVPGTTVYAVDPANGLIGIAPSAVVDGGGRYEIDGVASGVYAIEARWDTNYGDGETGYAGYYGDGGSPAATDPVTLASATRVTVDGADLDGIDVTMTPSGGIEGTISAPFTGASSVTASAYRWNGEAWETIVSTDLSIGADYQLGFWIGGPFMDLPAGTYTLGFSHTSTFSESSYPYCAAFYGDGASFDVVGGQATSGIDMALVKKTSGCAPAPALDGPVPVITGDSQVGGTLVADAGSWSPDGVVLAYQWLADGDEIPAATGQRLVLGASELGAAISVRVTGSRPGYPDLARTSSSTSAVLDALVPGTPTLSTSTPAVGTPLSVDPGVWGPGDVELAYVWKADGTAIPGATAASYTPTAADAGRALTAEVTGTRSGYAAATRATTATARVAGVTLSTTELRPGDPLEVHGTDFAPGEQVRIELHSTPVLLATVTATGGAFTTQVTIPAGTAGGAHSIVLVGSAGHTATIAITVQGGSLAATGVTPIGALALGGLLVLGGAALGAGRLRRLR